METHVQTTNREEHFGRYKEYECKQLEKVAQNRGKWKKVVERASTLYKL
jgi:hypothetical protein